MSDADLHAAPVCLETLATLDAAFGDAPGGLLAFVDIFADATRTELAQLSAAVDEGRQGDIAKSAHRLSGGALQAGAIALGTQCRRVEQAAAAGDLQTARVQYEPVASLVDEAVRLLAAYANSSVNGRAA
jgi:HPt (histidine-containing phosphotransfer) domain-containing protein